MRRTLSICTITLSLLLLSLRLGEASFMQVVPGKGTETTLDIASWNISSAQSSPGARASGAPW